MDNKIYLSTDWHFGIKPLDLEKWLKIQSGYFYNQLIPYLQETSKEGDMFIMLGDLFDNRTNIPILVLNVVEQILLEIGKIMPVHIIVGNHDLWNRGDNSINSPKVFNWLPNVRVYEETHVMEVYGKKLVFMPWIETKKEMVEEIKKFPGDYLFCHSDLNGCRMHLSSVAHKNKNKIDVEAFSGYDRVFSGHIHIRQIHKNFEFIGAPYQMDRNDYNDTKGLTILNPYTGESEFIENTVSPTFKRFKVENDGDLLLLEHLNTKKHFVDLIINNSVLIGKRKNRKLLEDIMGRKKFSTIEYVNDLTKTEAQREQDLKQVEIKLEDLQLSEFDETIVRFTESQEYENDTIKGGVLSELNNILSIYNTKYKFNSGDE